QAGAAQDACFESIFGQVITHFPFPKDFRTRRKALLRCTLTELTVNPIDWAISELSRSSTKRRIKTVRCFSERARAASQIAWTCSFTAALSSGEIVLSAQ